MKRAMVRLAALEKTRRPPEASRQVFDHAVGMVSASERALARVALRFAYQQEGWTEHDDRRWRSHAQMMAAKDELERAPSPEYLRSIASAIMTRGHLRWLGKLRDVKHGPFRAWETLSALPEFDDEVWGQITSLAADLRSGKFGENDIIIRA